MLTEHILTHNRTVHVNRTFIDYVWINSRGLVRFTDYKHIQNYFLRLNIWSPVWFHPKFTQNYQGRSKPFLARNIVGSQIPALAELIELLENRDPTGKF